MENAESSETDVVDPSTVRQRIMSIVRENAEVSYGVLFCLVLFCPLFDPSV